MARLAQPPIDGADTLLTKTGAKPALDQLASLPAAGGRPGPVPIGDGTEGNAGTSKDLCDADSGAPLPCADGVPLPSLAASAGGDKPPTAGDRLLHGHTVLPDLVPPGCEGEVDLDAEKWDERGDRLPSVGSAPPSPYSSDASKVDNFSALGVRFNPPAPYVPSEEAIAALEQLFTAVRGGWVGLLRGTLAAVVVALFANRGLSSRAMLQGMLVWWPLVPGSRSTQDIEDTPKCNKGPRGRAGSRLTPRPYPVVVQRRHLPTGERSRDVGIVSEAEYVTLSEVCPTGMMHIHRVVAVLLLLFDKEPLVLAVVDKKLAEHNVKRQAVTAPRGANELASITVDDVLAHQSIGGALPTNASMTAPVTHSDSSAVGSEQGTGSAIGKGLTVAVAARIAARRAAGGASLRVQAALQAAEASKKEARNLKRSVSAGAATPKKRLRREAPMLRNEALAAEFNAPDLEPTEGVFSCSILNEAEMLADHTYLSLATNWPSIETDAHKPVIEVGTATDEEWGGIVDMQKDVKIALEESTVRRARKIMMAKVDEMRGGNIVEAQQDCRVYIKVAARGNKEEVKLTAATLQAMTDLHAASLRLQLFRTAVEWLREAAGFTNARVPDFSGSGRASNGSMANEVLKALLAFHPTDAVWRLASVPAVAAGGDIVVPAHLLVKNTQDACMTDDIITVNTIILSRWCLANRPNFWVLHCAFFQQLLSADEDSVSAMAEELHIKCSGVRNLMGVCNINNSHWVTLGLDVTEKTVLLYDSGAHFKDLQDHVKLAIKKMQLLAKFLFELVEEGSDIDGADQAISDANGKASKAADASMAARNIMLEEANKVQGGGSPQGAKANNAVGATNGADVTKDAGATQGADVTDGADAPNAADATNAANQTKGAGETTGVGATRSVVLTKPAISSKRAGATISGAAAKLRKATKKVSTRKVKVPAQTDVTSCGPFAFSFLWHQARDTKAEVLSCDSFSVRLNMIAAVVRDGRAQEEAGILQLPR